jgi:hypothetical protein
MIVIQEPLEPQRTLALDKVIAVGFGAAYVARNGETIWQEDTNAEWSELWTVQMAEDAARKDPDQDWRIHLIGPLAEGHWQRQGPNAWVMYAIGDGFA